MSNLATIQIESEAKRVLKGIHFDFEGAHIALTDASQGGACSLMNDPLMLKSLKGKVLTSEQEALLVRMGHEISEVEKSTSGNQTPTSVDTDGLTGDNKLQKGTDDIMSKETLERIAQLEKALAVSEATNSLTGYGFEADVKKAVAGAIAKLESTEDKEAVTKAFDALVAKGEADVEKAKTAKPEEESDLAKALSEEAGDGGEAEEEVEKSLAQRAIEAQDKIQGVK